MNQDEDRLRYDVWANYALTQDDEASLGIPNFAGLPNNPYNNVKAFFAKMYAAEKEAYKTTKFKIPQHKLWAEAIAKGTYMAKIN